MKYPVDPWDHNCYKQQQKTYNFISIIPCMDWEMQPKALFMGVSTVSVTLTVVILHCYSYTGYLLYSFKHLRFKF